MDRETFERVVRNSTTGTAQSSRAARQKQIRAKQRKQALIGLCVGVALFTSISMAGLKALGTRISNNFEVAHEINEFHREVVYKNTHRTQDYQHYWYDYYEIGKEVKSDEDVYKLVEDIGEYQTNRVLATRDDIEDTVEDYIKNRNYKDMKDFKDTNYERILIQNDIEEKQRELNQMTHESVVKADTATDTQELGGK